MLFKRKTVEPLEFSAEIVIEAPASEIYEALNLRSFDNRYDRRNMQLTPIKGTNDQFELIDPRLPELKTRLTELHAEDGARYDMKVEFPTDMPAGILTGEENSYRIKPLDDDKCAVSCGIVFNTIPVTQTERREEIPMLMTAVSDDLVRLKALIEDGVVAAEKAGALDEILDFIEALQVAAE